MLKDLQPVLPTRCRALLSVLLLTLAACAGPPRVAISTPEGLARAATATEARALARLLSDYGPRVRELLPDARPLDPEVWLDDFSEAALAERPDVVGLASPVTGRIRIRSDRLGRDADFVLVHELVHALLGPSWEPLPAVMKEGLCDALACRLVPDGAPAIRALRLLDAAAVDPAMALEVSWFAAGGDRRERERITPAERPPVDLGVWLSRPGEGVSLHGERAEVPRLYGCGWLLTERVLDRIGLDGLHRLCLESREQGHVTVPVEWLLRAGALQGGPDAWRAAVLERVGAPELAAQCAALAPELAGWLVVSLRERFADADGPTFLERALPTIGWVGGRQRLALAAVPGLASQLAERWSASRPLALRPGGGWWLRDAHGVHLTSLLGPTDDEPGYSITRLELAGTQPLVSGGIRVGLAPAAEDARLELMVILREERDGLTLTSVSASGFASFRLWVDGALFADLRERRNLSLRREADGTERLELRLPGGRRLEGIVLYDEQSNLVLSQRGAEPAASEITLPLRIPRREP